MTDRERTALILAALLLAERRSSTALVALTLGAGPALVAALAGRESKPLAYGAALRVADGLEADAEASLYAARLAARQLAREKTITELTVLGLMTGGLPTKAVPSAVDSLRAARSARSLAQGLVAKTTQAIRSWDKAGQPSGRLKTEVKAAAADLKPKAQTIAVTESAHAFHRERRVVVIDALSQQRDPVQREIAEALRFRWNAELDRRTCSVCDALHGTTWDRITDAPDCPRHPRCRCMIEIVTR